MWGADGVAPKQQQQGRGSLGSCSTHSSLPAHLTIFFSTQVDQAMCVSAQAPDAVVCSVSSPGLSSMHTILFLAHIRTHFSGLALILPIDFEFELANARAPMLKNWQEPSMPCLCVVWKHATSNPGPVQLSASRTNRGKCRSRHVAGLHAQQRDALASRRVRPESPRSCVRFTSSPPRVARQRHSVLPPRISILP